MVGIRMGDHLGNRELLRLSEVDVSRQVTCCRMVGKAPVPKDLSSYIKALKQTYMY
jgi:hypothetical protein